MSQIYIRRTFSEVVVVSPPYRLVGLVFLIAVLVVILIAAVWLLRGRAMPPRAVSPLAWFLVAVLTAPFLILGGWLSTSETRVVLSKPDRTLKLRKTVCWVPVRSDTYSLSDIRSAQVGTGDVCHSLFMVLNDGSTVDLIGCTDRQGYGPAADAINRLIHNQN